MVIPEESTIITHHWFVTLSHNTSTEASIVTSRESSLWLILWQVKLLMLIRLRWRKQWLSILRLSILFLLLIILHLIVMWLCESKLWLLLHELSLLLWLRYFHLLVFLSFHEICIYCSFLEKFIFSITLLFMTS